VQYFSQKNQQLFSLAGASRPIRGISGDPAAERIRLFSGETPSALSRIHGWHKKTGMPHIWSIFRHPGCLGKTLGFPPHPRGWFSIIVYHEVEFLLQVCTNLQHKAMLSQLFFCYNSLMCPLPCSTTPAKHGKGRGNQEALAFPIIASTDLPWPKVVEAEKSVIIDFRLKAPD
jgi:hypothetical protein